MTAALDLSQQMFGRLTVLCQASNSKSGKRRCLCRCSCGHEVVIAVSNLRTGHTVSCGCASSEVKSRRAIERNTVHGQNCAGRGNQSPTWLSWKSMRQRCLDASHKSYPSYGGRGITICDRWSDFRNFLADMGGRPAGRTLDRIDVNKGYSPENCRWATASEQQRNKRCAR